MTKQELHKLTDAAFDAHAAYYGAIIKGNDASELRQPYLAAVESMNQAWGHTASRHHA
jgi:hypothetical protein